VLGSTQKNTGYSTIDSPVSSRKKRSARYSRRSLRTIVATMDPFTPTRELDEDVLQRRLLGVDRQEILRSR
jgi:hypothetical protein